VLVGDSYLEIGESDDQTLSEQLKAHSGLTTCNLGRANYGPHQYLKVLQRYAMELRPQFALFCFFSGNDIQDIQRYEEWQQGQNYYDFASGRSFLGRFKAFLLDIGRALEKNMGLRKMWNNVWLYWHNEKVHPDLGLVRLGDQQLLMCFGSWNPGESPEELINTRGFSTLRKLLADFRDICCQHGIAPVIVYLPHKMEIYADLVSDQSGRTVRTRLANQLAAMDNMVQAFRRTVDQLNLELVDMTTPFREAARKGVLLYYPFDTHWNPRARQMAAQLIASRLRQIETRRKGEAGGGEDGSLAAKEQFSLGQGHSGRGPSRDNGPGRRVSGRGGPEPPGSPPPAPGCGRPGF
jgi:hypothetical protein